MTRQKPVFILAIVVLLLASLLGGGQGFFGDVLAQLSAVILMIACLFNTESELKNATPMSRLLAFLFIVSVLIVPILQLYPWPNPNDFARLMQADLQQAGVTFSSTSINKTYGAERALYGLLPACAVFIACLQMPSRLRYRMLMVLAGIVALNIMLGFLQLAQGQASPMRLYELTNRTEAVGFFANRNHFASLLMMFLPISLAFTAWWVQSRNSKALLSSGFIIGATLFCVLIVLAIAVARSRAVLMLAAVGILLSLPALFSLPQRPGMKRVLVVVAVLGSIAAIQFGLFGILQRFDHGIADKTRMQMTQISVEAGRAYAPMGSGLGTFRQAYAPFEARHDESIDNTLTNHAHNDYAELWLEAGYPGVFAIGTFCFLFVCLGIRVWGRQKHGNPLDVLLSRVAWISIFLVMLHSYVDYPLRTTANTVVFALLLSIAIAHSQKSGKA